MALRLTRQNVNKRAVQVDCRLHSFVHPSGEEKSGLFYSLWNPQTRCQMTLQNARSGQTGNKVFLSYQKDWRWLLFCIPVSQMITSSLKRIVHRVHKWVMAMYSFQIESLKRKLKKIFFFFYHQIFPGKITNIISQISKLLVYLFLTSSTCPFFWLLFSPVTI